MRAEQTKKLVIIFLISIVILSFLDFVRVPRIPVTSFATFNAPRRLDSFTGYSDDNPALTEQLSISEFVENIADGQSGSIRGVYATGLFALRVVQQPAGNAAFVSTEEDAVTQFSLAQNYNSIGLLAHNTAAGQYFFNLMYGDIIEVVYGDGDIDLYKVEEIRKYQALSPYSSSSNFTDLLTGETFSAANVFYQMYSGDHHLTLQTCIQKDGIDAWGRLFIIAYPL